MPIVRKSLDELLEEIEFKKMVRYDFIVPQETPYRMLFTFTDYLKELSSFLGELGIEIADGSGYADAECPVYLALDNAYSRGNTEQDNLPITAKFFSGLKGVVIRVRDCGEGFDFEEIQQRFETGQRYYQGSGAGFRAYNSGIAEVSFEGNGSVVNIAYKFGGLKLSQLCTSRLEARWKLNQ